MTEWIILTFLPHSVTAAEIRWTRRNKETRERGCPCGRRAEKVKRYGGNVGRVSVEWWTCAEHEGATSFSGRVACWKHDKPCPQGQDRGRGGPIGGPTAYWSCPHREHS